MMAAMEIKPSGDIDAQLTLVAADGRARADGKQPMSVSLFDQGLSQVLQASVTGLPPKQDHVLALASQPDDGGGSIEPLAKFTTNPARSAIVNAVGPIRQIVQGEAGVPRRYLVILRGDTVEPGIPVQVQSQ